MTEDERPPIYSTTDEQRRRNLITVFIIFVIVGSLIATGISITLRNAASM